VNESPEWPGRDRGGGRAPGRGPADPTDPNAVPSRATAAGASRIPIRFVEASTHFRMKLAEQILGITSCKTSSPGAAVSTSRSKKPPPTGYASMPGLRRALRMGPRRDCREGGGRLRPDLAEVHRERDDSKLSSPSAFRISR
jgi:hypothetical protein